MECCTLTLHDRGSLKPFRGGSSKGEGCFFLYSWRGGTTCDDLHRNYGMEVILLSLLFNYDNLILKLHQKKCSYLDEGWFFIGRLKVECVPGMSVVLVASKNKSIKIHEYDTRPLIKSYNSY